jgi:hypothetical protein
MTEHTQIKQNKYSTHDKPKFEFTENPALWTVVRPFYILQTQRPKIVNENVDPNITKCTQLGRT